MDELKKRKLLNLGWKISTDPFEFLDDISKKKLICEQKLFNIVQTQCDDLYEQLRELYWKNIVVGITTIDYIDLLNNYHCDGTYYGNIKDDLNVFIGLFGNRQLRIMEVVDDFNHIAAWTDYRMDGIPELCISIDYTIVNEEMLKRLIKYWLVDKKTNSEMNILINKELEHQFI